MIRRNDPFTCAWCKHENPPAEFTCRNHCRECLYSMHVDLKKPGDRASTCEGIMKPTGLEGNDKRKFKIVHECQVCGQIIKNRLATDDNFDVVIKLSQLQNQKNAKKYGLLPEKKPKARHRGFGRK